MAIRRTLVLLGLLAASPATAQIPNAFAPYWESETSPVLWEHQKRELHDSLIENGKTRDEALREVADTQERMIRNFLDNRVGAMRQSLGEFLSMAPAPGSASQAGEFVTGNLHAPNLYGASTSAPFARHSGDGTLILRSTIRVRSDGDYRVDGRWLEPGVNNGWTFDLGGGLLERYVDVLAGSRTAEIYNSQNQVVGTSAQCEVAVRYVYRSHDGATELFPVDAPPAGCVFGRVPGDVLQCGSPTEAELAACDRPVAVSRNGQALLDVSDRANPILRRADGSIETFRGVPRPGDLREEFLTGAVPWELSFNLRAGWVPATRSDRNGLTTQFEYDELDHLRSVISPRGVRLDKEATTDGFEIRTTGIGGNPQIYRYHFATIDLDYSSFGDITCRAIVNGQYADMPCSDPRVLGNTYRRSTTLLTRIELPDGTSYRYEYGPWGNLTKAIQPTGAITTFVYGEGFSSSSADDPAGAFFPIGWTPNETSLSGDPGQVPEGTQALLNRRVTKMVVAPDGADCPTRGAPNSAACQYTLVTHERSEVVSGPHCDRLFWIERRLPTGVVEREATCQAFSTAAKLPYSGRVIAVERYASESAATPIRAQYFGDLTGTLWVDFDRVGPLQASDRTADMRPTRIVSITDGLATTEVLTYGTWQVSPSTTRSSGNVTSRLIYAGDCRDSCTQLIAGSVADFAPPAEDALLLRLPLRVETFDASGPLQRTDFAYDEQPVEPSGFADLAPPSATHRGNPTTTIRFIDPSGGASAITRSSFWDTGDVLRMWGPRAGETADLEITPDFRGCDTTPILETITRNALGHESERITDCATGKVLAEIDASGARTCTAYDTIGRTIAVALPGDGLPAAGIALDACRGGDPTQTIEYPRSGIDGPVWTFVHRKDKTADGLVSREFTDGLGRVILACREGIAPGEPQVASAGATAEGELCTWTTYDGMGRVESTSAPTFRSSLATPTERSATQRNVFAYDALGRILRAETFVGDAAVTELGAMVTSHTREGDALVTTVEDPDGSHTRIAADALGHVIAQGIESEPGVPGCNSEADGRAYCTTRFTFDGLGRTVIAVDAAGNRWENRFDGLGRRTRAVDPDLGTTLYTYDALGLVEARDTEGRATLYKYDAIGRQVVVDAPALVDGSWVNGPSADDEITFYDYKPEGACQRCTGIICLVSHDCGDADWSLR